MMDMNVAHAVVRSMPSNAVFGPPPPPLPPAGSCRNGEQTRNVTGAAPLPRRTTNVDVSTTTMSTTAGLSWQHQTAAAATATRASSYDNSTTPATTTATATALGRAELDCAADRDGRGGHLSDADDAGRRRQTCAACGRDIVDRFLLHAIDRYWHTGCLRCSACHAPLADLGATCFTRAGMTLCRDDYIR